MAMKNSLQISSFSQVSLSEMAVFTQLLDAYGAEAKVMSQPGGTLNRGEITCFMVISDDGGINNWR
ncbi:MAG: hypothetical protein MZV63_45450 [Marinilabiliales bacterium]|nr:hypothetical protein [Marinilabiliales bacterium]